MLKNYLKIALRALLKSKLHTTINILGLAVGLSSVLLISLYVIDELSYDDFHKDANQIYRVAWWSGNPQTRTPHPMAQAMVSDFEQVEAATSLTPLWGPGLTKQIFSIKNPESDIVFDEREILGVDSTFFDVFSFPILKGNPNTVLREIGGIMLSESAAKKYFGDEDPIGKQLSVNSDELLVTVEGIFQDVPHNSHFHFDALISYVTLKAFNDENDNFYTWNDFGHFNYIKLQDNANPLQLQDQLLTWVIQYLEIPKKDIDAALASGDHFKLQPLTDIHLKSAIRWELEPNGNIEYVYILTAAALLVLIIACVNFMNLNTARSTERSKEIGIRKSLGAFKKQISMQFMGESLLIAICSMILAGLIAEVVLPVFNVFTQKSLSISYSEQPELLLILGSCAILSGLFAGFYPALYLSSLNPVKSLKGLEKIKPKGAGLRKTLIVLQFVISMVLLTGSLVIYNQMQFIQNKDLGFSNEQVLVVPFKNYDLLDRFEAIKEELSAIPGVQKVTASSNVPGRQFNQNSIAASNDLQNQVNASEVYVDYDFFSTLAIEFIDGRPFSRNYASDSNALIINETAARQLQLVNPVGEEITWYWDNNGRSPLKGTVIGVVKDFNYQSLHRPIQPLVFYAASGFNNLLIKVDNTHFSESIASIENVWKKFEDRFGFEYSLLQLDMNQQYQGEQKTAKVLGGFSFIAIVIACFGLFGMASISFNYRKKEVGIRKVLGASVSRILSLLLQEFTGLILVSIVLAVPLAWLILNQWLENFTYRINIQLLDFLIAGLVLIAVALVTIAYLTLRTAQTNPVETLNEE